MSKLSKEQIVSAVMDFARKEGGVYSEWYAGISENPCKKLQSHNVCMECKHKEFAASSASDAYLALDSLIRMGFDGCLDKDPEALFLYVYKKTINTRP